MPLLIHGEVTDPAVDVFDREHVFIDRTLAPLVARFPRLKIVLEHITTAQAVQFVMSAPANVAATITAHHLLMSRNALFQGGIRPHHYCLPVLKREEHRKALLSAATSGNPKFFLGTDSAPHARHTKETDCGCAGMYTAHAGIELYAEAFEQADALTATGGVRELPWCGLLRLAAQHAQAHAGEARLDRARRRCLTAPMHWCPCAPAALFPGCSNEMRAESLARYAWLSIAAALATIGLKTAAWWFTGSVGLLSDAIESLVNLAAAIVALWMLKLAERPPDEEHAYGYSKAEYFSSGFEGGLIFLAALAIVWTAVHRLLDLQPIEQRRRRPRDFRGRLAHQSRRGDRAAARGQAPQLHHARSRRAPSDDGRLDLGGCRRRCRRGRGDRLAVARSDHRHRGGAEHSLDGIPADPAIGVGAAGSSVAGRMAATRSVQCCRAMRHAASISMR